MPCLSRPFRVGLRNNSSLVCVSKKSRRLGLLEEGQDMRVRKEMTCCCYLKRNHLLIIKISKDDKNGLSPLQYHHPLHQHCTTYHLRLEIQLLRLGPSF
jgi:hypothetical protein